MKKVFICVCLSLLPCLVLAQDTVRIASYNALNYPGITSTSRNPSIRTVVSGMDPDILVVQEMTSAAGMDEYLGQVMNYDAPGTYMAVPFHDGPDTDSGLFYRGAKWEFLSARYIPTGLRDIAEYVLRHSVSGEQLRIYSVHLKASTGYEQDRLAEATILRNYLNNLPAGTAFVIVGDYNIYTSAEPAFLKLTGSEANNNGQAVDPVNLVGNWHDGTSFAFYHTQSTRIRSFDDGATGGLDDRFDILLTSPTVRSRMVAGSYRAYGNDGYHLNDSINQLPNYAVPAGVALALHNAADHLPVMADFVFPSTFEGVADQRQLPATFMLEQNFPNPFNPATLIMYQAQGTGVVTLKVYDVLGREVATLVNERKPAGRYEVRFDAAGLASGVYFYRLKAGNFVQTRTMLLLE